MYCELPCGVVTDCGVREAGFAGLTRYARREGWREEEMESFKEDISWVVLPRRVILKRGVVRGREERGVSANGGFWRPGLGDIRSFWFSVGTETRDSSLEERSISVESGGKDNV